MTVTHQAVTVRVPGEPTEHRPLREGEIDEWLSTLEVPLSAQEHARLLERLGTG